MNIKIAVADDDKNTREMLKNIVLKVNTDMHVFTAENGEEMCEIIKTHSPDIIITDLIMPVCDGIKVIRFAREHCPYTPVIIAVSELKDEKYMDSCFEAGADYYAQKPVDTKEFENLMRFIVSSKNVYA